MDYRYLHAETADQLAAAMSGHSDYYWAPMAPPAYYAAPDSDIGFWYVWLERSSEWRNLP